MRHTGIVGWRCSKPNRKYFVRIIILDHSHPCLCLIADRIYPYPLTSFNSFFSTTVYAADSLIYSNDSSSIIYFKFSGPKLSGSSSSNVYTLYSSIVRAKITANADGLTNSRSTCLHTPHGAVYPVCASASSSSFPPTIAIAVNSLQPSLTALNTAVRSAQFPGVNAAFSILHPVYIFRICPKQCRPNCKVRITVHTKTSVHPLQSGSDFVSFSFLISYTALSCIL